MKMIKQEILKQLFHLFVCFAEMKTIFLILFTVTSFLLIARLLIISFELISIEQVSNFLSLLVHFSSNDENLHLIFHWGFTGVYFKMYRIGLIQWANLDIAFPINMDSRIGLDKRKHLAPEFTSIFYLNIVRLSFPESSQMKGTSWVISLFILLVVWI